MLTKYDDLPLEQEAIVAAVIGCAINVHRILGPGFQDRIYHTGFRLELESQGLEYESEKPIDVKYRQ
jgi:GxxExxY protein